MGIDQNFLKEASVKSERYIVSSIVLQPHQLSQKKSIIKVLLLEVPVTTGSHLGASTAVPNIMRPNFYKETSKRELICLHESPMHAVKYAVDTAVVGTVDYSTPNMYAIVYRSNNL